MSQRQTTPRVTPSLPRQPNDLPPAYWKDLSAAGRAEIGIRAALEQDDDAPRWRKPTSSPRRRFED